MNSTDTGADTGTRITGIVHGIRTGGFPLCQSTIHGPSRTWMKPSDVRCPGCMKRWPVQPTPGLTLAVEVLG